MKAVDIKQYNSILLKAMFQNSYQNGTYFDLLDPKLGQEKLKLLYRTVNVNGNNKVFDKDLKTFVFEFQSPNAKMCLPRQQKKDLYLIQQYLVFQIYFYPGLSWNIELVISDLTKTKRRIILSPTSNKLQVKPFFVKTPAIAYQEATWNNFVVDLYSYIEPFKGQTYRSLDSIYLTGHFKLRRIYTSTSEPIHTEGEGQSQQDIKQINFLPKNFYYPVGLPHTTQINRYDGEAYSQATYEPTEPSTKNSSFLNKPSKPKPTAIKSIAKVETVKTEKVIKEKQKIQVQYENKKIKDFLSNTNGEPLNRKKKEDQKSQSQTSQVILEALPKTAKSTQKYTKKKNLIKTQQMPPKARSSLQKNGMVEKKVQDKSKTKAKLNPWRTNSKEVAGYTDNSQLEISKNGQERSVETPQTVSMFKNNNNKFIETKNQRFQGKSEQYSDSQYVELSQKFSTLTDGKFFKNQLYINNHTHLQQQVKPQQQEQDQIEENIEMESNSMYSSHQKQSPSKPNKYVENIHQSICDSLDRFDHKQKKEQLGRSSLYGFGQKLMKRFMNQVQRPYSPPLGEREITEEQVSQNFNNEQKEEVELVYDPVLNCYYDHKTHTYYQLKN